MHQISLSGLSAAQARLNVSAHNTANGSTEKFQEQRVTQSERKTGGTDADIDTVELSEEAQKVSDDASAPQNNVNQAEETIERIETKHSFKHNLKAIRARDEMDKKLLDTLG